MQDTQETGNRTLGQEDSLEEEMATHSSILAWRVPWTAEPDRLQSMGSLESDMTYWLNNSNKEAWIYDHEHMVMDALGYFPYYIVSKCLSDTCVYSLPLQSIPPASSSSPSQEDESEFDLHPSIFFRHSHPPLSILRGYTEHELWIPKCTNAWGCTCVFDFTASCQLVFQVTSHSLAESGDPRPHTAFPRLESDLLFWAHFETWGKMCPRNNSSALPVEDGSRNSGISREQDTSCNLIHRTTDIYNMEDLTCMRESRLKDLHSGWSHYKQKTKPWGQETNSWLSEAGDQGGDWLRRSRKDVFRVMEMFAMLMVMIPRLCYRAVCIYWIACHYLLKRSRFYYQQIRPQHMQLY